jgi:hypothetical protein
MLEERKSALLLLINLALLVSLLVASYYGALTVLWQVDVLKLSFLLILLYFATAFAITFNLIGEDLADAIEARLPMIALCGTVYGILSVFQVLAGAKLGSAADFKNLIGPLLAGGGTAMWPTFLALLGSNLLWAQILIRHAGRGEERPGRDRDQEEARSAVGATGTREEARSAVGATGIRESA